MSTPRFDLVDIAKTLQQRHKFILIFTLIAALVGAVVYKVVPQKFEASSEVLVANPMVADRNYIFRSTEPRYIDFFAGEDDIDHVMAIAFSDNVKGNVITHMNLYKAYDLNETNKDNQEEMGKRWKKSYDVKRTEYKNVEISFKDTDPVRAANVVNDAVRTIETTYRGYYNLLKEQINNSLKTRMQRTDSAISVLTDSIAALKANISSNLKNETVIRNLETIQNQYALDQAKYVTLMNEFTTGTNAKEMEFVQVISPASPPLEPAGLGMVLSIIACAMVGFFVSVLATLMNGYFKALTSVER